MDIRLMEIAGTKPAGTYFLVTDNSAVPDYVAPQKARVAFINSEFGPVNCAVYFAQGDSAGFTKIFGSATRKIEKTGNFSHSECLTMLTAGPLVVINLRKFNNLDLIGITGMSANQSPVETKTTEYPDVFNTNTLWFPKPKNIVEKLSNENLLNFANIGKANKSLFVVVSNTPSSAVNAPDERLIDTELKIDDYPALVSNPDLTLADTIVDVYIFDNTFDPTTVSTNKYYGHLFNQAGMVDYSKLDELTTIRESGFQAKITGSIIPSLVNENGEAASIDTKINNTFAENGIICYINDDTLEDISFNDQPVINTSGVSVYELDGTLSVAGNILSHRIQPVTTIPTIDMSAITDADVVDFSESPMLNVDNGVIDEMSVISVFENKIRLGDTLAFETTTNDAGIHYGNVSNLELIEEVAPGNHNLVTRSKPTNVIAYDNNEVEIEITFPAIMAAGDKVTIYRKLANQTNDFYTKIYENDFVVGSNSLTVTDTSVIVGQTYLYYSSISDGNTVNQTVNSVSQSVEIIDNTTATITTGDVQHNVVDGPIAVPYLKTWKKVKITLDGKLPNDVSAGDSYTRIAKLSKQPLGKCLPTNLESYKPRKEQFTNGTAERQKEILDMMLSTSIVKGFKNIQGARYLIDCFKSFVESGYKYQFSQLASLLDERKVFVRSICNEPFIEDLEKSTDPLFRNQPGGTFDISYLKTGGNPEYSIKFLTKPDIGQEYSFFFGGEFNGREERPIAGKVSNLFINKANDFDVVANETGIINVTGLMIDADDIERKAMEDFRWNPTIKQGTVFTIYGNLTGQKKLTGLTQIQNSELLCMIKTDLYAMSRGEAFRKGLYNEYLTSETEYQTYMNNLALAGAIQPNPIVICNLDNNTPDISKQRIKLIQITYGQVDALDKVVFDLNLE